MPNSVILSRAKQVFVVPEVTAGTLVYPVATDAIELVEAPTYSQKGAYSDSARVRNSRTAREKIFNGMEFGTLTLKIPAMLNAAGTAPEESILLQGIIGGETVTASTSVAYDPALKTGTYSVWLISDGQVLDALAGVKFSKLATTLTKEGELVYDIEATFQRKFSGGTALLGTGAIATDTALLLDAAYDGRDLFFVGQHVDVIDAGTTVETGLVVSAVSATSVTVSALGTGAGIGSEIRPTLPTPSISGSSISMGRNKVFISGVNDTYDATDASGITVSANFKLCDEASIEISQEIQTPTAKEMTGNDYPSAEYIENSRVVSGSFKFVLRRDDADWPEAIRRSPNRSLVLRIGDTAGSIVEFLLRSVKVEIPEPSETDGATFLTANFTAFQGAAGAESEVQMICR